MDNERHDLIISGSGSASGGDYENVEISGSGRVKGDIECKNYKISGTAKIDGNVKAKFVKVSGSAHHYGNLESEVVNISGSTHVDGHVAATDMAINGSMKIGKHLSGEKIEVSGSIRVKESCAMEAFKAKGSFDIGGLLNADDIDIMLYHDSEAREIGGGTIKVKRGSKGFLLGMLLGGFNNILTTDCIEGDDLDLEFTHAKVVRGKNVRIGEGCEIELVEYTNEFQKDEHAKVKESKRI